MAATYTPISKRQIETFFDGTDFQKLDTDDKEIVYGKRVDDEIGLGIPVTMRVYTSVDKRTGVSRKNGSDAIRVYLFYRDKNGTVKRLCGTRRVHRTQNWTKNLSTRIMKASKNVFSKHTCPKCDSPMVLRTNGNSGNTFWGCSSYPVCSHTIFHS